MPSNAIEVLHLGVQDYLSTYEAMKEFTQQRTESTQDQIWVLEHPPVFTLGLAGEMQHLLVEHSDIPVVRVDRGGQITYHGPGQLVVYLLLNLKRQQLYVRELVNKIEQAVIDTLLQLDVYAQRKPGAPGIYLSEQNIGYEYLAGAKIAALGLKITKQCTYHGLSLNVNMDLKPFEMINPCGYPGMQTVDLASLNKSKALLDVSNILINALTSQLHQHHS
ncbi:lipoyl(octanoyl) transferase LipB [Polynucleobacter kasalickyi]|uniref:Octanoyltransferase n=1 Tax=Polynucleobacter kasalickyi TaxID=1938817 RepID=A0A1W2AT54_9BURK|nr:lipoyl(octanoyl) transferase LipB [Polynucleobacter kasalickyi]SMC63702.1 lipoyl(octanoyl) transferase [Polynucleobacter kasalickyi]